LIRKILEHSGQSVSDDFDGATLGEKLLAPTRIYVKSLLQLNEKVEINALSHITGGGLLENIPRVLPAGVKAVINADSWQRPAIFDWLQTQGNVAADEMYRTFNNGIGMVVVIKPEYVESALAILNEAGETAMLIGHIAAATDTDELVEVVA
jgi:phosphoribosylformylglycinamidine cyclo-ligase